jgi:Ca2+:H+ antiporter
MDISIQPGRTLCVLLSVLIAAPVAGDGESNWLKGVALLAVYLIFALAFLAAPEIPDWPGAQPARPRTEQLPGRMRLE